MNYTNDWESRKKTFAKMRRPDVGNGGKNFPTVCDWNVKFNTQSHMFFGTLGVMIYNK